VLLEHGKLLIMLEGNKLKITCLLHTNYTLVKQTSQTLINSAVFLMPNIEWE